MYEAFSLNLNTQYTYTALYLYLEGILALASNDAGAKSMLRIPTSTYTSTSHLPPPSSLLSLFLFLSLSLSFSKIEWLITCLRCELRIRSETRGHPKFPSSLTESWKLQFGSSSQFSVLHFSRPRVFSHYHPYLPSKSPMLLTYDVYILHNSKKK